MMFSVEYDDKAGIICCSGGGFLKVEEIEQYGRAMQGEIRRSMREFGNVGLLSLSTESAKVQTTELMEAARDNWRRLGPDNRMALVVSSALMRMQAARIYNSEQEKVFATEAEGRAWLLEWRAAQRGGAVRSGAA